MPDTSSRSPAAEDALEFLSDDQEEILELFDRYDALVADNGAPGGRRDLAEELCSLVAVHAQIKREILYPAAREALADETPVDEAVESHDALDATIDDIQSGDATEPRYDAGVRVLQELFVECVDAERSGLYPLLRRGSLDLEELGGELAARAEVLLGSAEDDE